MYQHCIPLTLCLSLHVPTLHSSHSVSPSTYQHCPFPPYPPQYCHLPTLLHSLEMFISPYVNPPFYQPSPVLSPTHPAVWLWDVQNTSPPPTHTLSPFLPTHLPTTLPTLLCCCEMFTSHTQKPLPSHCTTLPTLLCGCEVFITLRVSRPVYTTTPRAVPDATTVLAQSVFSTDRESSTVVLSVWEWNNRSQ